MAGISLLWLIVPAMGLATYVQYVCSYYEDRIRDVKTRILEIKKKYPKELVEKLESGQKDLLERAVGDQEDDGALVFSKKIIWFIAFTVVAQWGLMTFTVADMVTKIVASVLFFVFFYLFYGSNSHIDEKKNACEEMKELEKTLSGHLDIYELSKEMAEKAKKPQ